MDPVREIVAGLASWHYELPVGGEAWLYDHPEAALDLASAVRGMKPNEYVEFEFSLDALCWMADERVARDHVRDEVDAGTYSINWTGR